MLVDEDRTAVGRVRVQVGRGSRCYPVRIACIFREVESRSSFWRHRPTAGYVRHFTHTAARACSPPAIPTTTPTSGLRGAARARCGARARRERRDGGVGQRRQRPRRRHEAKHSKRSSLCRSCFIVSTASVLLGVLSFFALSVFAFTCAFWLRASVRAWAGQGRDRATEFFGSVTSATSFSQIFVTDPKKSFSWPSKRLLHAFTF